jgi:hypothetical protein
MSVMMINRPTYYWIVSTSDSTGRRIIYGCKRDYAEAEKMSSTIHNAHTEIVPLNSKDESAIKNWLEQNK